MTAETMETARLRIRSSREEDGPFCLSLWLDDENGKYMADPPRDKADEDELNFAQGIETQEGWYPFVAELKETGERMGTCSVVPSEDERCWDLGYCVRKDLWRQGYGAEIIRAMIDFGLRRGGRSFTASVAQENIASNAVLRKLGFHVVKEGSYRKRGTSIVYPEYQYRLDIEE